MPSAHSKKVRSHGVVTWCFYHKGREGYGPRSWVMVWLYSILITRPQQIFYSSRHHLQAEAKICVCIHIHTYIHIQTHTHI